MNGGLLDNFGASLGKYWWLLLLRGLIAIAFGVLAWVQPQIALASLVLVYGAYALADGLLGIWMAIAGRKKQTDWWLLLLWGVLGVIVGVLTLMAPGLTALALLIYIAVWSVATGVLQIIAAVRLRREIQGEWLLILAGLLSIAFGVVIMARPDVGALSVLWIIGTYAVMFGVVMTLLSFKVKRLGKTA